MPGDGGAPLFRAPDRGGKPADGRVHAQGVPRGHRAGAGEGVSLLPAPQAASREPGGLYVGRRAADDGDRPRADGPSVDDPARRAVDGPRAAARRGDLRDRAHPQSQGGRQLPARRAEHAHRAALRRLRLHPGERPGRHGRRGGVTRAERGREGVLPWLLHRRPAKLPGSEVLPATRTVALKHYDRLETRSPKAREKALMAALPGLIAHARRHAPGFARVLKNVVPSKIKTREALATLPVTRKSDL